MALNCSPKFCLKLTYRYLLKTGRVPDDTWEWGHFWPQGHNLYKLGIGSLGHATSQISRLYALLLMVSDKKIFSCFSLYKPM